MIYLASLVEETDDKLEGCTIIKTKAELNRVVADNRAANRVKIRRGFAQEFFTPSGLLAFVENAKALNRNLVIELDEASEILTLERFKEKLRLARSTDELISLAAMYPKEFKDTVAVLARSDLDVQGELLAASNRVSRLQATVEAQRREMEELKHSVELEQKNKYAATSRLESLIKRINYQYGVGVDERRLFELSGNRFDKIVYVKEYSRVQYMDSFLYYLKEILKILYSMPTRMLVIESFYGSLYPRMYPGLVPHFKLKERDVIAGDILMLGIQPHLMEDILKNSSNVSILIVLDRGGYQAPHLHGGNVTYFYSASDVGDLPEGIPNSRIISYSEDTLFIPLIKGFEKMDSSERVSRYSSMEITKHVIKIIEGR